MLVLQVLCNAAKTDKARLQALEVDLARLGQRAENAEKGRVVLQDRLQQLQVCGAASVIYDTSKLKLALKPKCDLKPALIPVTEHASSVFVLSLMPGFTATPLSGVW